MYYIIHNAQLSIKPDSYPASQPGERAVPGVHWQHREGDVHPMSGCSICFAQLSFANGVCR